MIMTVSTTDRWHRLLFLFYPLLNRRCYDGSIARHLCTYYKPRFAVNFIKLNMFHKVWIPYPLLEMAANGITIAPMRMGDLVNQKPSNTSNTVAGKYTPPSKRSGTAGLQVIDKIDMSDKNFPTLGSVPKKLPAWGNHIVASPLPEKKVEVDGEIIVVKKKETLSDKIKEKIRLDAIDDEKGTLEETDPWKMNETQLKEAGWVRLRLGTARDIAQKGFANQDSPFIPGYISEADSGMSFEEYIHYKKSAVIIEPLKPYTRPVSTPLSEDEDEYSDVEDY